MIIQKYDLYKDSGIEYLGKVPNNWKIKRVKNFIEKIGSGVTPKGGSEIYPSEGIPFLRSQNVHDKGLKLDCVAFITDEINSHMKSSQVKPNDILINLTGASIGRTCIIPNTLEKANINQHIAFIRIKRNQNLIFLSLFLKSHFVKEYISYQQNGASKEAFNLGQISILPVLDFSKDYLMKISENLNKRIKQIDKKINIFKNKQNNYEELKKSLINETVCRGLNKNVQMKETGIECIGQIPRKWEVKILKNVFSLISSGINNFKNTKEYLSTKSITNNKIIKVEEIITYNKRPSRANMEPQENSLWFAKLRFTNKSYLFENNNDKYILSTGFAGLKNKLNNNRFAYYYIISNYFLYQKNKYSYGTTQEAITEKGIKSIIFIKPPKQEQKEIANYLDDKISKIDKIENIINKQIETLVEFRKTLINDVVTGKVRIKE